MLVLHTPNSLPLGVYPKPPSCAPPPANTPLTPLTTPPGVQGAGQESPRTQGLHKERAGVWVGRVGWVCW